MKTILTAVFTLILTAVTAQEQETIKATFDSFEEGVYYFTDGEGFSNEFDEIDEKVLTTLDLRDSKYLGKVFMVTFVTETETDNEGEDIMVSKITGIKLVES